MSSTDSEKCNSVEGQENESRDTGNEAENNAPVRQPSLAPLTIGLCLAVFLLAVDRTIIAVVSMVSCWLTEYISADYHRRPHRFQINSTPLEI